MKNYPETVLQTAILAYEERVCLKFRPPVEFYGRIGINRIRFWQLVKGKKEPFASELVSLSNFFNVPLDELCKQKRPDHYRK
jgi:hypothetical protein